MNLGTYGKTVVALVTGVIGWCAEVAALPGGFSHITAVLWVQLATVIAIALGVYSVANVPASTTSSFDHNPVPPSDPFAHITAPLAEQPKTTRARKPR